MRILIITNYNHNASKEIVKFLKFKKLKFDHIDSNKKKKIKISKNYDYLLSFLSPLYIDKSVRKRIRINSFNFHPGPPEYPGFGCYNFALLDKSKFYGSTVHIINDRFDNGKIINVKRFKISYERLNLEKLINKTHKNTLYQAKAFINGILNKKIKISGSFKWKRKAYTKKEFEKAREVKLNETKANILRKIKAFSYKNFESVFINFKGCKFVLKKK